MKKTMIMIVFVLALGSQAIANGFSELKLRTNGNQPLKVIIDGQLVSNNATTVSIKDIPAGKHSLQVFQILTNYNSYNEEPLFFGEIFLPGNTVTKALIKHHRFVVEQQFALYSPNTNVVYAYQGNNHYNTKPIFWETPQIYNTPSVCNPVPQVIIAQPIVEEVYPMSNQDFNNLTRKIHHKSSKSGVKVLFLRCLNKKHPQLKPPNFEQ